MKRELIIDDMPSYIRAALLENGKLCEIHGESKKQTGQTESLFLGRVQAIKPALKAAFVDIGAEQHAFLPMTEDMHLRCGEMMIVQGQAKQATDSKGLRITNRINLAGKWLVLIPGGDRVHISKKVKDPAAREMLLNYAETLRPEGFGLIVRTASEEVTEQLLDEEVHALCETWKTVQSKAVGMMKPGLLHGRQPLHARLARDVREVSRIVVNSHSGYQLFVEMQRAQYLDACTQIELDTEEKQLLFDRFGIEQQIDKALHHRVWLPCGGYLVLDFCEAMTVIDVNSGKMTLGKEQDKMALNVNLEAADEIARQLRLRDMGGMIIVDFISMHNQTDKQAVLDRMKEAVSTDRSPVTVEGLTRLGLMELTRKRTHEQLHKALRVGCSYCSGQGEVLTPEETARRAYRQVRRMVISGQRGPFIVRCAAPCAQALGNLRRTGSAEIYALVVSGKHVEKYDIEQIGIGTKVPDGAVALKTEDIE